MKKFQKLTLDEKGQLHGGFALHSTKGAGKEFFLSKNTNCTGKGFLDDNSNCGDNCSDCNSGDKGDTGDKGEPNPNG